jgi:pilus assembly protein CpaB
VNTRRLFLALFGALVISGSCTMVLGRKIAQSSRTSVPKVRYVAASKPIAAGEIVKAEDVIYTEWPASQPVEGAFAKPDDVTGRSAVYPMTKGQIVLNDYLAARGAGIGLTTKIPDGMRAIALKSDEVVGVAGFLFPGARVDVLVTYRPAQGPDQVTSTVLQNAQVVAVGHQIQPDPAGMTTPVDVVTILANPNDAEKVVLASTLGSIHFVLRNGSDQVETQNATVQLSQLGPPVAEKAAAHKALTGPAKPKPYVVQTIMGDKQTTTSFN